MSAVARLQSYVLSPFKVQSKGRLHIPEKYLDVILSLQPEDSELDWENLPATDENWKHVRELLVSGTHDLRIVRLEIYDLFAIRIKLV